MAETTAAPRAERFDRLVESRSLLNHPFYQAWEMGSLPVDALSLYAGEYGAFIAAVAAGWERAGSRDIAEIERAHTRVWDASFAASLGTRIGEPRTAEVRSLVAFCAEAFSDKATALGALYAFEAQQPLTAQSKLRGLNEHYSELPAPVGHYFKLHENDYEEPALLMAAIEALDEAAAQRAYDACETMCAKLWDALSGVYKPFEHACA